MTDQQQSTDFNQRVGANLQEIRKAAGWSQADLAAELTRRGMPFYQPTILKIEKGSRPLKLEEACAIADALEIDVASLCRVVDNDAMAAAVAQIQRNNIVIARTERGIEEAYGRARENEKVNRDFIERVKAVRQEAEQRLRDAGAVQDGDGTWRTPDGKVLLIDKGDNGKH
jgi:transcriptional regulator with XRE-family HTH domain